VQLRKVVVNPEMVQVAGDLVTGVLLSQINWWYRVPGKNGKTKCRIERDGSLWIAKTREEWMGETGLSLEQYKRALKLLKSRNLIEVKIFQFKGIPISHLRMTFPTGVKPTNPLVSNTPTGWRKTHQPEANNFIGFNNIEVTIIEDNIEDTIALVKMNQDSSLGADILKTPKTNEVSKEEYMDLQEILKKQEQKVVGQGGSMTCYWQARVSLLYPGEFMKPLTVKEASQLKQIHKHLLDDTRRVVDWCLEPWWKFSMEVKAKAGLDSVPSDPRTGGIGFLLKYCDVGMNLYLQSIAKPEVIFTGAIGGGKTMAATKTEEKPATLEEIEKIIAGENVD